MVNAFPVSFPSFPNFMFLENMTRSKGVKDRKMLL